MIHMPWVFVYSARATAVTVTVRLIRIPPGMYMPLLLWEQAIHIHTHACILYISVWILTGEGTCFRDKEKLTLSAKLCNGYRRRRGAQRLHAPHQYPSSLWFSVIYHGAPYPGIASACCDSLVHPHIFSTMPPISHEPFQVLSILFQSLG